MYKVTSNASHAYNKSIPYFLVPMTFTKTHSRLELWMGCWLIHRHILTYTFSFHTSLLLVCLMLPFLTDPGENPWINLSTVFLY